MGAIVASLLAIIAFVIAPVLGSFFYGVGIGMILIALYMFVVEG